MNNPQRFLEATTYTVSWFWKRLIDNELDMQPPYQRNPVWQEHQKAYFIDTIIRGYPAPEIYLQTTVDGQGKERHIVIDGQQRIRACLEFIENRFPLGEKSEEHTGLSFDELPDDARKAIFGYKFVVRTLPELPEDETRDIFARLNRNNVALNRQELRHATYWGEFITCMEELSRHDFWPLSGLFTSNEVRRMLDIEYISELAIAILFGQQNKKSRLDHFYGVFENEFPDKEKTEKSFNAILSELESVLEWPNKTRWSRKVDFYTLFSLLSSRVDQMPFSDGYRTTLHERLVSFSSEVSELLRLEEDDRMAATRSKSAYAYARGVRNSSDLGSRRMRLHALRAYLDDTELKLDEDAEKQMPTALDRLPSAEELLADDAREDEYEQE